MMAYDNRMEALSPRQREIQQRDLRILREARTLLLSDGYYAMTMDRIADASECPKGTVYQRFASKEDIVAALASDALQRRIAMMKRGADYPGRARERMVGTAEGFALFTRMNPDDSRILHMAAGPIREKASHERLSGVQWGEHQAVVLLTGILNDAVREGDLSLTGDDTVERLAYGFWAMAEGGLTLLGNGIAENALNLSNPLYSLWMNFNRLADVYGWHPLGSEECWEDTLANVRKTIFPDESERTYGKGCWYGDR